MAQSLNGEDTESLLLEINETFPTGKVDLRTYSPLALAFLGDAVYSTIVRTIVVCEGNRQAEKLHKETTKYVSAQGQAKIADAIQPFLTEEEKNIYRRGHNANPYHHAKNASLGEYKKATALEVLCGYLYLTNRTKRFLELMKIGRQQVTQQENNENGTKADSKEIHSDPQG